jgi:hypothetical protein
VNLVRRAAPSLKVEFVTRSATAAGGSALPASSAIDTTRVFTTGRNCELNVIASASSVFNVTCRAGIHIRTVP